MYIESMFIDWYSIEDFISHEFYFIRFHTKSFIFLKVYIFENFLIVNVFY